MGVNFNPGPGGPSADLAGADFAGATVRGLGGDNLTGANLTGANLRGANFYGSNLTNADFSKADLTGGTLSVTTLTGTKLGTATLTGIAGWGLTGTPVSLPGSWSIRDSCLIGPGAVLPASSLTGANLSGADLAGADLAGAYMASSNLTGTNLTRADLANADLTTANLTKANLAGATITGAKWAGVIWSGTTCPDGTNSDAHVAGCFSARLYGFGGFISPVPGSRLAKSAKTIVVTFRLTGAGGKPIAAALAAKLAAGHHVRVTLSGPRIKPVNVYCAWKARQFSCVIRIPAGAVTGTAHRYQITAAENLGTGFKRAPVAGRVVNPEAIYFK
jgi:uncharacterized protein YjbI with pentapeptide repeats